MKIEITQITGLVLAGGRGSRMGGVDKGLQPYLGEPLVQHALRRLAPQVGTLALNANRNLDVYAAMGLPVWPDELADYPGPMAGMLAGLAHCATPYVVTVPCDTPNFPLDLVERLAQGLAAIDGELAMACTREDGVAQPQPVFCLMRKSLFASADAFVRSGQGKIGLWASRHLCARVVFEDAAGFFNANTPADLERLHSAR